MFSGMICMNYKRKPINSMNFFAFLLVILFAGAGVVSLYNGRLNEAIYGFLGAAINYVVYFKPFHQ